MQNGDLHKKCKICTVSEETMNILRSRDEKIKNQENIDRRSEKLPEKVGEKIKKPFITIVLLILIVGIIFAAVNYQKPKEGVVTEKPKITVFYSPTCSCCSQYIAYLKGNGFEVVTEIDASKRMDLLDSFSIPEDMTACHSSLVGDYFVEGHVPYEAIKKLLEEKPDIDGIALPGMPQGAPGMGGFGVGKWTIYSLSEGKISEFIVY